MVILLLVSCTKEDMARTYSNKNRVQVVGRITSFNEHTVSSRGLKDNNESKIKCMSLFIFDNADKCINYQHIESSNPMFVIERDELFKESRNINGSKLYILANIHEVETQTWVGKTLTELMQYSYHTNTISIPEDGFPMIGHLEDVNLDPNDELEQDVLEIPLDNLYAKIVFNVKVNTIQTPQEGVTPSFQLTSWEVHNVPSGLSLGAETDDGQTLFWNQAHATAFHSTTVNGSNPVSGSNVLSFFFYMPEHKVNPAIEYTDYEYPFESTSADTIYRQRFKPCLVDADGDKDGNVFSNYQGKPTYVRMKGAFTDHQGHVRNVEYDVFLGTDNYGNFDVIRNYQYNNNVTIVGLTNYKDAEEGTISVDHRVNLSVNNFVVAMERETLLDSHIEIRPVHVEFIEKADIEQKVEIYLSKPETPNAPLTEKEMTWVRMELASSAKNDNYCSNGKRKYFTTTLLDDLNSNVSVDITSNTNNCAWLYFDENTNVSTDGVREVVLNIDYYENNVLIDKTSYTFQQHDLYPAIYTDTLTNTEYRYDIEFYEEYLYHYDAYEGYGNTTEGMAWGPKEVISDSILAIQDVQSAWADNLQYIENAIKNAGGYYDFQSNDNGRFYTEKLIKVMDQQILSQEMLPQSAAQHCHNKNKRNQNGEVETLQWYLPAIGELQHIMGSPAHIKFEMFQENQYWSSQTSYKIGHFKYELLWGFLGSVEGDYFYEDINWARATSAVYQGNNQYFYEPSEIFGISKTWTGSVTNQTGSFTTEVEPTSRDSGNRERDKLLRVRAVRNKYKRAVGATEWIEITE